MGRRNAGVCNDPDLQVPSYIVANIKAGYEGENFSIYGFARNVFDENYVTQIQAGGLARSAEPRVAGVEVNVFF